jgi:hypothetical protein
MVCLVLTRKGGGSRALAFVLSSNGFRRVNNIYRPKLSPDIFGLPCISSGLLEIRFLYVLVTE